MQGPTTCVGFTPTGIFKKIRVFGIDSQHKIVEWAPEGAERAFGPGPRVIEQKVEVMKGGIVTAIGGWPSEEIRLYFQGADGRAYQKIGYFNGGWNEATILS